MIDFDIKALQTVISSRFLDRMFDVIDACDGIIIICDVVLHRFAS